ncbi:MAG: hypothetical protein GY786_19465, partial [Proteobacteria bacterium]|nr:hypothetical protein [Pseudomonadota bacterium]
MDNMIIEWFRKFQFPLFILLVVLLSHNANAQQTPALVFHDDFHDGSTKWETTDDASWNLTQQKGRSAWGLNK